MMCPYVRGEEISIRNTNSDEETGFYNKETIITQFKMLECKKEECAVWRNSQCNYMQEQK